MTESNADIAISKTQLSDTATKMVGNELMLVFDDQVNLSSLSRQRRTLSVGNPNAQTILRICIIFGHH